MKTPVDFSNYLRSLCDDYAQWWKAYAFMEEIDDSTWFEFELYSKTQEKAKLPGEKPTEKTQPVLEAICEYAHEKILIVGNPGAGKSTLLARVMSDAAQQALLNPKVPVPVLVELKLYGESGIWELIQAALENHNLYLEISDIKPLIADKRLLLLADGFNELPTERTRAEFKNFCKCKLPIIVTTRDWASDVGIDRKVQLQNLGSPKVEAFFQNRLPGRDQKQIEQLCDRVRDFGQTPLMVWMLFSVVRQNGEIPATRGEAYRASTTLYAERAKEGIDLDESRGWLSKLAFAMMQAQKPTDFRLDISEVEAQNLLGSEKTLKHLVNHHLLHQQGKPGNRKIRFCHQSLQEYYAAEYLLPQLPYLSDVNLKCNYLNLLKWTEPLAVMLSLVEDDAQAVRVVNLALEVDLMLGAKLAGAVKPQFHEQTVGVVSAIDVPEWLKVELLGRTRSEIAIPGLLKVIVHKNSKERWDAAEALGKLGSEAAIPGLFTVLENEDPDVRWYAAYALGKIGCKVAIPGLLKAIKDKDSEVRQITVYALGEVGCKAAILALLKALDDEDSKVSRKAATALYELGMLDSEAVIPGLLKAIKHKNSKVRWYAVDALGDLGSDAAVPALLKALDDEDSDVRVRAKIVYTLGLFGSETAVPALLKALDDKDSDVRWSAMDALGNLGSKAAIPDLLKALDDENSFLRLNAACTLGKIGSEKAIPIWLQTIKDGVLSELLSAAEALVNLGSEAAISALLKAIEDKDDYVRRKVAQSLSLSPLGKLKSEVAILAFLKAVYHEDSNVRLSAAETSGKIQNTTSAHTLPNLLTLIWKMVV